jgi:hypothetical protein
MRNDKNSRLLTDSSLVVEKAMNSRSTYTIDFAAEPPKRVKPLLRMGTVPPQEVQHTMELPPNRSQAMEIENCTSSKCSSSSFWLFFKKFCVIRFVLLGRVLTISVFEQG